MGELLGSISSAELTEWQAYYQLEPFGALRDDLRAGIVASTVANVMGGPKKPFSPADFMPLMQTSAPGAGSSNAPLHDPDPEAHARLLAATLFGAVLPPKSTFTIPPD